MNPQRPAQILTLASLALSISGCIPCGGGGRNYYGIDYELRVPANEPKGQPAGVQLVDDSSAEGGFGVDADQPVNGFRIRRFYDHLIHEGSDQYGIVVQTIDETGQVFVLPLRCEVKPQPWTAWVRPTYVTNSEAGDAWLGFLHGVPMAHLNINPDNAYQLRFRIQSLYDTNGRPLRN